ncbi:class I SAM-dependent methyltransferase [Haloimpatiens sp. FM7330]|uniref:class I SAM-dependent methyltransferase n=1 Tax=Haloimpatiens sp. FM7330 TaxID=3298610 RepID=UPI003628FAFC
MKNNNMWEKSYQNTKQLWSSNPDAKLMQYFDLIEKGSLLDLGIGEGRNVVPFALTGFNIDGVDISETALERCRKNINKDNLIINLTNCDLTKYDVKKNEYTLIIAANVLNFFKKSDIEIIIKKIKDGLKEDGIIYLSVFSTLDPQYNLLKTSKKQIEDNTFYIDERDTYKHFFTKEELNKYFSDFELICCCEGVEYDHSHGEPHYHGGIEFMARKRKGI